MTTNVGLVTHYVHITVHNPRGRGYKPIDGLSWRELTWEVRTKWNWYFRYRAALLQVKYPKSEVEMTWGHVESKGDLKLQQLKNQITAKKRKITEYTNKIRMAEETWNQLFPIQENDLYKKANEKVVRLKNELSELEELFQLTRTTD